MLTTFAPGFVVTDWWQGGAGTRVSGSLTPLTGALRLGRWVSAQTSHVTVVEKARKLEAEGMCLNPGYPSGKLVACWFHHPPLHQSSPSLQTVGYPALDSELSFGEPPLTLLPDSSLIPELRNPDTLHLKSHTVPSAYFPQTPAGCFCLALCIIYFSVSGLSEVLLQQRNYLTGFLWVLNKIKM